MLEVDTPSSDGATAASGQGADAVVASGPPVLRGRMWLSLGLLVGAFAPILANVVRVWWDNPEYSHGFLMPLVALWLAGQHKEEIRALTGSASLFAIPVLILALLARLVGELDYMNSIAPFAFVGGLGGILLAFVGWRGLKVFLPVLVVLLLACPLPGAVQQSLTLPLKTISSEFAVGLLDISGIPSFLEGAMIHLEGADSLWVADACSGIRSFISLLSIAIIACLVWNRHWVLKLLVILAAIPIAVFVNGFRIWLTGWLSVKVSPEAAAGAFHFFEGFALFALAGLLLLGFAALLGALFPRSDS